MNEVEPMTAVIGTPGRASAMTAVIGTPKESVPLAKLSCISRILIVPPL